MFWGIYNISMDKKAEYDVKVKAVDISPYPIARGKPTTFSISATTDPVTAGLDGFHLSLAKGHCSKNVTQQCTVRGLGCSCSFCRETYGERLPGSCFSNLGLSHKDLAHSRI
ncbi:uncharacterized protein LOC132803304 [Ziziphus jujuba]|uniref:Uncharacterized protein LOC132803304 n=1 Tax=Ziziphus jujuba TaxID=326968 RepID=A0ABM4A5E8_ZIZJJ|nr:uncharacterized protein LOC132803304 [Ziziphus jujuba]